MTEKNYNEKSVMKGGFPRIKKLGAVSPCGESTPFRFGGRLYRLELEDPTRGTDPAFPARALIRDRETGEVLSRFGQGCYYHSLYQENGTVYVVAALRPEGDTLMTFVSRDLVNWESRALFKSPGWRYYNTSLTKGPEGYVLCVEASEPAEAVGVPFTAFFAFSPDLNPLDAAGPRKGLSKAQVSRRAVATVEPRMVLSYRGHRASVLPFHELYLPHPGFRYLGSGAL